MRGRAYICQALEFLDQRQMRAQLAQLEQMAHRLAARERSIPHASCMRVAVVGTSLCVRSNRDFSIFSIKNLYSKFEKKVNFCIYSHE